MLKSLYSGFNNLSIEPSLYSYFLSSMLNNSLRTTMSTNHFLIQKFETLNKFVVSITLPSTHLLKSSRANTRKFPSFNCSIYTISTLTSSQTETLHIVCKPSSHWIWAHFWHSLQLFTRTGIRSVRTGSGPWTNINLMWIDPRLIKAR